MTNLIPIGYQSNDLYSRSIQIAEQFKLTVDNLSLPRLSLTPEKLVLLSERFLPLSVDFNSLMIKKRHEEGKKQGLIRACKPVPGMKIIDATAGWGKDAMLLASFGAEVLMLERHPVMAALLSDGLRRLSDNSPLKLSLLHIDTKYYLDNLSVIEYPDLIYIDPMHPVRQKSALVKKNMQLLQGLIGSDDDVEELVRIAMSRTRQHVVVKWPQRQAPLLQPDASIQGKTIRFDLYLSKVKAVKS